MLKVRRAKKRRRCSIPDHENDVEQSRDFGGIIAHKETNHNLDLVSPDIVSQ